jgi:hypothetical protein
MRFGLILKKTVESFVLIGACSVLLLVGCGGYSGGSTGTTSYTIAPFKGPYSKGVVTLKDANGNAVPLVAGGTINASGVAEITFDSAVVYPLIVEVIGDYYNENTGTLETGTVPLRGLIAGVAAVNGSVVPVTIITETAVADLQNRLGAFSPNNPIDAVSAVSALQMASFALGIPATVVPNFDSQTNKTSDPDTLRLAALAVVAGNQPTGATLVEKIKLLSHRLATINPASAPADVIPQADFDSALLAVTTGPNGMMATGMSAPVPSTIGTLSSTSITSLCKFVISGGLVGGEVLGASSVGGLVYLSNSGGISFGSVSSVGAANYGVGNTNANAGQLTVEPGTVGVLANTGGTLIPSGGITLAMAVAPSASTQVSAVPSANSQVAAGNISWGTYPIDEVFATSGVALTVLSGISGVVGTFNGSLVYGQIPTSQLALICN